MSTYTHGHTAGGGDTATYRSWRSMMRRCLSPGAPKYPEYGGRGVTICERWRDFARFLADMGERPTDTSIDRIDNDGNYEPGNCRWATVEEQRRNQRRTKLTQADADWIRGQAETLSQKAMAESLGVHPSTISLVLSGRIW